MVDNLMSYFGIPKDEKTGAVETLEYQHHEIHGGSFFVAGVHEDLAGNGSMHILFCAPTTVSLEAHVVVAIQGELETEYRFFSGPTIAASGTNVPPVCQNRNSPGTAESAVRSGATPTDSGDLLFTDHMGGGSSPARNTGGQRREDSEWIVGSGAQYMLHVENMTSSNNNVVVVISWYEHTSKTAV
jgi:hypothetical protein